MTQKPVRGVRAASKSIGEVLAALKVEFPDVTVSKLRFLESQGLVEPERTASGYRKFSEGDIARLRYILREQKEHFLPLKVIKDRLGDIGVDPEGSVDGSILSDGDEVAIAPGTMFDRAQLAAAVGVSEPQVKELDNFGLLRGERSGNTIYYDERALKIARLAARFLSFGAEPRHLRLFKSATDREADLYKQLAVSGRSQRNTQARMESAARLEELGSLGQSIRAALLQRSIEDR